MGNGRKFALGVLLGALGTGPLVSAVAADPEAPTKPPVQLGAAPSRDALFDVEKPATDKPPPAPGWRGFVQGEVARAYRDPAHWSKARLRLELSRQGQFSEEVKWRIGGRFDYDAAYDRSSFYPPEVRRDQRYGFTLRENYLDVTAGAWDFRLGRQHVVWGEMVGLFFADVVSAKDMREFLLPEFEVLRIPQWAMRAETFQHEVYFELLWIPVPSFDEIGKPGADFFPRPLPVPSTFLGEDRPSRKLSNSNYGFRVAHLKAGWDLSAFYYHSLDAAPTFYRVSGPGEPLVFQPRHDWIDQVGGTLSKDLGAAVLKGELVYTDGRKFNVVRPTQPDGLVRQNTLDYALGLDFTFPADTRLNLQVFQRVFFDHDPDILSDKRESGAGIRLDAQLAPRLEARAHFIRSLNRNDWLFRSRLAWGFERNWRLLVGVDIFHGPPAGFFGRFANNDRVYTELRYSF